MGRQNLLLQSTIFCCSSRLVFLSSSHCLLDSWEGWTGGEGREEKGGRKGGRERGRETGGVGREDLLLHSQQFFVVVHV